MGVDAWIDWGREESRWLGFWVVASVGCFGLDDWVDEKFYLQFK